jgi:hypothetical protein
LDQMVTDADGVLADPVDTDDHPLVDCGREVIGGSIYLTLACRKQLRYKVRREMVVSCWGYSHHAQVSFGAHGTAYRSRELMQR